MKWSKVKSLLSALGISTTMGRNDHTILRSNDGKTEEIQEPAHGRSLTRGTVVKVKSFLNQVGINPQTVYQYLDQG